MNRIKNIFLMNVFTYLVLVVGAQAKMVPFQEDGYMLQAPENLLAVAEKVANIVDFTADYEVVVPKKAGIEINPWNKFIAYGTNPLTKNFFMVINPEWFNKLPEDQQLFLVGRNFLILKLGVTPLSFTVIFYAFIIISLLLLVCIFLIFSKTVLKNQKIWIRILLACALVGVMEFMLLDPLERKLKLHYGKLYDKKIHESVVEKTKNRDAAIKALEYLDSSIKDEIKKGETLFVPYENLFETYAQQLKQ